MKRTVSVFLTLLLLCTLVTLPAEAAFSNKIISKDTTLSQKFNSYNDLTLQPGVTLTTKMAGSEPQGIEMHGKLTVGANAKIVGQGLLLMFRGSSYEGITLYYKLNGETRVFPDIATAYERYRNAADYVFQFRFDKAVGGWVWTETLRGGDPFEVPESADPFMGIAKNYAETLKALRLLKGAGTNSDGTTDYALGRNLTRGEAVILMVRLLGKEEEAMNADYPMPFTDVPADSSYVKHIAYAYAKNITKGVSATEFNPTGMASANMYITFILRAMGYNDSAEKGPRDFTYDTAPQFASTLGITLDENQIQHFRRCEAVLSSFYAVRGNCKSGELLFEQLIGEGVFSRLDYETVMNPYTQHR